MKVLLLMSDTGGGHRAAAQAISENLRRLDPSTDVEVVDVIKDMSPFWFRVVSLYGPIVRKAPWLWGLLFRFFGSRTRAPLWQALVPLIILTIKGKILPYVHAKNPDVVCSTHPLINQCVQYARDVVEKTQNRKVPFMVVITDPVTFHPTWIEPRADLTVVATQEAFDTAVACGAPQDRVRVMGLPIHPGFFARGELEGTVKDSTSQARAELQLPHEGHVILVCGGGEGMATTLAIAEEVLALPSKPHVLAVAGRNKRMQTGLEARMKQPGGDRLTAFGFTDRMGTLMRASDVIVTKAGPGTMFEAMALGKPLVIADALPGQEEGNVDLVRNHKVGVVAMDGPKDVATGVGQLLAPGAGREELASRAMTLSRPNATREISEELLRMGGRRS